ncbi:hypothetical protein JQ633_27205 [Bradyrhizobium tropiciagri]|uniref:hypothetical protein n=1 Tax=Bradyrhizobium tropiciagri TaxID=312253 RepID=UPI001BAD0447|nr:hypothetical protein [Bradyrhizobium tropiciagri]MBR0874075.1 hypothetical protein [Bradyrhizobium tropiciagri]
MTAGADWKRAVAGAAAGLVYGILLAILSLGAAGDGHGTLIPLVVSSAPLGVAYLGAGSDAARGTAFFSMLFAGPVLWVLLGFLVALPGRRIKLAAVLLLMHDASALGLVAASGLTLRGIAKEIPDFVLVWGPAYLLGQAGLWWRIFVTRAT